MKVREIVSLFESIAPSAYQENYDNSGLIIGDPEMEISKILLSLDTTEAVIDEAIRNGCNMIVAHHPIIFKGLKRLNGKNYVERTVIKAVKNDIALLAVHTNLDNVLKSGVNQKFATKLGITNLRILSPKSEILSKIFIYVPESHLDVVREAMFKAGAGQIGGYSECSFSAIGKGTFKPGENSQPFSGEIGVREQAEEYKVEVLAPSFISSRIIEAARAVHPYQEMAYEIIGLLNYNQELGSGVIGELSESMSKARFLAHVKQSLGLEVIKHTIGKDLIRTVAVCGGSGSFLIGDAMRSKADAYVTSDIKYHEFFDAEDKMLLCDVGHYESEILTLEIFYDRIKEKFPNFAVIFCTLTSNPIQYFK